MHVSLPGRWGSVVSSRGAFSFCHEYSVEGIRKALREGEKTFLIGADAVSHFAGWLFAVDHLALFGSGSLVGPNDPIGPRFPNLRGMYVVPALEGKPLRTGIVMRVPDMNLTTGAELKAFTCDALVSSGIDQAVAAAHGGAKVAFLLNCRPPDGKLGSDFSFLEHLLAETEKGEELWTTKTQ